MATCGRLALWPSCFLLISTGLLVNCSLVGKFVTQKSPTGGSVLNILNQPSTVLFVKDPKPIPANEITSILSLALGFSVPKELSWRGLLSGNPFKRPDAAIMITVDSLPSNDDLKIQSMKSIEIKSSAADESRAELFSLSNTRTLSSHLSEMYDGKSYTLSLSANEDLAAAGYSNGENSQTIVWSDKKSSWMILDSKNPKGDVLFSKDVILSEMERTFKQSGVKYYRKKNEIIIKMKDDEVKFNLDIKADFMFFSELTVSHLICSKIESMSYIIKDGIPDVYMIGISTLKDLQKKYGSQSPKVLAAISVLEHFIPEVTDRLVKLYNGNAIAVQVSLKESENLASSDVEQNKEVYHKVKNHLQSNGMGDFYIKFHELHVPNEIENHVKKSLCEQMSGVLSGFGVNMQFKCAVGSTHHRISRSLLAVNNQTIDIDTVNLASLYQSDFPVIFNLWFWLVVVLFLALYAISYVMWYMDPGKDSIIYRMTSQRIKTD